jgi:hypothetical protein
MLHHAAMKAIDNKSWRFVVPLVALNPEKSVSLPRVNRAQTLIGIGAWRLPKTSVL